MDILQKNVTKNLKRNKKWRQKEQIDFFMRLAELLEEGFSISESITFLAMMMPNHENSLNHVARKLNNGEDFSNALEELGISKNVQVQIHFSIQHGSLIQTLRFTADHLQSLSKYQNQFVKLSSYPLLMMLFSFALIMGVRNTILPTVMSMGNRHSSPIADIVIVTLENLPQVIGGLLVVICLLSFGFYFFLRRQSSLQRATWFAKLPFVGLWFKYYYSFQFSREVGYFLKNGHSIQQMILAMSAYQTSSFIVLLMIEAQKELMKGETFPTFLSKSLLFFPEFHWIVYHGELTNQVGIKLLFYSAACYRQLEHKIERALSLIQPILFGFIGVLIIGIYVMIMLPMLSSMKGVLG